MAMFQNKAKTVTEFLAGLTPERRAAITAVRKVIRKHLPAGYKEGVNWGAIGWTVPLSAYPDTYNGQPLCYVALASQKTHASLYLMAAYAESAQADRLREGFRKAGKKLDMGKACIRFRQAGDLPLDVIGDVVASTPMKDYIALAKSAHQGAAKRRKPAK